MCRRSFFAKLLTSPFELAPAGFWLLVIEALFQDRPYIFNEIPDRRVSGSYPLPQKPEACCTPVLGASGPVRRRTVVHKTASDMFSTIFLSDTVAVTARHVLGSQTPRILNADPDNRGRERARIYNVTCCS